MKKCFAAWPLVERSTPLQPLAPVGESPDLRERISTRALVTVLRGWWICLDAQLTPSERTRCYLLWLASSGLM
jgi:hypothetical protein